MKIFAITLRALFGVGILVFFLGAACVWPLWPTLGWGFALITPLILVAYIQIAHDTETDYS
jgi:hypothetical protein